VIVAIDGPAGAGKSTVARRLAERLGFRYLDTGAMYRALTWLALDRGLDLEGTDQLVALARENPVVFEAPNRVLIGGHDVTQAIREPLIDRAVPVVARQQPVRAIMRDRQRELGEEGDAVIEGRDIGKVVAPGAEVKVYLVADEAERTRRRLAERPGLGADALATDLKMRDASDAPQMEPAEDAVQLDTTELSIDQVVDRIEGLVRRAAATVR
jgi:cytidylate kinase